MYKIADILHNPNHKSRFGLGVNYALIGLIILNVIAVILESVQELSHTYEDIFYRFELISVLIFIIEYVLRLWSIKYANPPTSRLRWALKPLPIIDLLAIAPTILSFFFPVLDLRFLRIIRTFRIFRITRYWIGFATLLEVIRDNIEHLASSISVLLILIILSACGVYLIERHIQPDDFGSILDAMWWALATLTTIGYGDSVPITPIGKLLAGFIALLGVGMAALPSGILAAGFIDHIKRLRKCPHCGTHLHETHKTKTDETHKTKTDETHERQKQTST